MTALSEKALAPGRASSALAARARGFIALTKPKLVELLLVTTLPAMMMAADGWPSWTLVGATMVGGMFAAGAANTFNCWYDRDIDAVMSRTRNRPIPAGVLTPRAALVFGGVLAAASLALLWAFTTPLAVGLAAVAILAYSVVYTMVLKRRTRHNTVFGAFPGAAPVLIGWAAVTGSLDWPALAFFAVVFCWQMPHFWALASRFRGDYAAAGVPMLSVVAGPESVGRQSVLWAWATLGATLLMGSITPVLGWAFAIGGGLLGAWYVVESHQWLGRIRSAVPDRPMKLFSVSITQMTLLSIAIGIDVLL